MWQKQTCVAVNAEAMAATIETNLRDMVEINGGVREKVLRVSKESIATAPPFLNNGGNGFNEPEPEFANQLAGSSRKASEEMSDPPVVKKRATFAQSFFNFFKPASN